MELVLLFAGAIGAPVGLAVAAWRWGFDSRDGFFAVTRSA
jgi:hypothetical protein